MNTTQKISTISMVVALTLTMGCSQKMNKTEMTASGDDISMKLDELKKREMQLAEREKALNAKGAAMQGGAPAQVSSTGELLPPAAKPGECFARVWRPAKFETKTERVVKREASEKLSLIPAKYQTVSERVLVTEASEKLLPVPATYRQVSERVLVQDGSTDWYFGKGSTITNGARSANGTSGVLADAGIINAATGQGLPSGAKPGQCYHEYYQPAQYTTQTERVLKTAASKKVSVVPAKYQMVEERVLVSEATETVVEIPASYENVSERVLVRPAYTTWKKGTGPIQRIDESTGEIMCLVEVPAEYKTVTKRVMKTPPSTKTQVIPAKYTTQKVRKLVTPASQNVSDIPETYQNITKRVKTSDPLNQWRIQGASGAGKYTGRTLCLKSSAAQYSTVTKTVEATPATVKRVAIPAEYKTVSVRKLVTPSSQSKTVIPAEYDTVTKRVKVQDGQMEWRSILCETNMTKGRITDIQRALARNGHNPGAIDGVIGSDTIRAVNAFQRKKGLPVDRYLNIQTLNALGVSAN